MTTNFRKLAAHHRAAIPSYEIIHDPEAPNGGRLPVVTVRRVKAITVFITMAVAILVAVLWLSGVRLTTSANIRAASYARLAVDDIDRLSDDVGLRRLREHNDAVKLFRDVMTVQVPEGELSTIDKLLGHKEFRLSGARRQVVHELSLAAERMTQEERTKLATAILVVAAAMADDGFQAALHALSNVPVEQRKDLFRNFAAKLKIFIAADARQDRLTADLGGYQFVLEEATRALELRIEQVQRERAQMEASMKQTAGVLECVRHAAATLGRCPVRSPYPVRRQ
jgi:hypothetical protein